MANRTFLTIASLVLILAARVPLAARAEVISLSGSAEASIQEIFSGQNRDSDQVLEQFPGTDDKLPLRVIAALDASGAEIAAARVAAQLADPRQPAQPNPEEFAINLALNSVTDHIRYSGTADLRETRGVIFRPGELGDTPEGETATVEGRLFLDGALAIFSTQADRDLTGAFVELSVRIIKTVAGVDETVYSGRLKLNGRTGGQVAVVAEGDFPTNTLILSDLPILSPEFAAFNLLIIPQLTITYEYQAAVGQEFTLTAEVKIAAENLETETGVAGLLGTPTDSLAAVIAATQGNQAAAKMLSALETERAEPTGEPAFETPSATQPVCGLFGFESLLGFILLSAARFAGVRRRT